jgi:hypothetical protein
MSDDHLGHSSFAESVSSSLHVRKMTFALGHLFVEGYMAVMYILGSVNPHSNVVVNQTEHVPRHEDDIE